ncbi:deoxyribodipyrimidine photo-lyase [Bradyrhizobium sp. UFLA05-153]
MPGPPPIIVWFRDDLRLSDHLALHAATRTGAPVICLYVLDDTVGRPLGGAARWWLAQSLRSLAAGLAAIGGALTLRRGPAAKVIPEVARESEAAAVYWNEIAQAPHQALETKLKGSLTKLGVASRSFLGNLLASPSTIRNKDGRGLRVFTPFWRRVLALGDPPKPLPAPKALRAGPELASDTLESFGLEPARPDWAGGLRESWQPGETHAHGRLRDFLKTTARDYASDRDRPDLPGTSRLSPHLRFGEISPRELWHSGVMHNRVRMVVASFLVKHLLIDWRQGEEWFWDTLVDADPGSNPANWQWVAGCGADAAPYFRVFNPVLQGEKFDPDGTYVRRWVPELRHLPAKLVHQPWQATPIELASAGVELGHNYPRPLVDHAKGRERALAAYAKIRRG